MTHSFPESFELAIAACLREYAETAGVNTWTHCASNNVDLTKDDGIKAFPQILITAGGKYQEQDGTTWAIDISCDCATWYLDDATCELRSNLYRDVERILDSLIYPCGNPSPVLDTFLRQIRAEVPTFQLGGLVPSNGGTPFLVDGAQVMTYSATIHFTF